MLVSHPQMCVQFLTLLAGCRRGEVENTEAGAGRYAVRQHYHTTIAVQPTLHAKDDPLPRCRHCDDQLPNDCTADVTSCRSYANWKAGKLSDMLTADDADVLGLFAGLCERDVAFRDGLELLQELD